MLAGTFGFYGLLRKTAPLGSMEGLSVETALMSLPALVYLLVLEATGQGSFGHAGAATSLLLAGTGVVTAVPLLLFAWAARNTTLATVGILQYIAPTFQFLLGLLDVGARCKMARRPLQVIRQRPVILETQTILDQLRNDLTDAAQLRMAKGIRRPHFGNEISGGILQPLGNGNRAETVIGHALGDARQKSGFIERQFGKQQNVRRLVVCLAGQPASCGDPAGVTPHDFHDENLGRGRRHRSHVETGLAH